MTDFEFTNRWFEDQRPIHEQYLTPLIAKGPVQLLEIGSHEGRSTVYFLQKLAEQPENRVTCIDPYDNTDSTSPVTDDTYRRFLTNVSKVGTVRHLKTYSLNGLTQLVQEGAMFDYILIDGSHLNKDVMLDASLAWHLLRSGGIIFFDDYNWGNPSASPNGPSIGITMWRNAYDKHIEVLHVGYHMVVRKK